jgi:hypothetical protein
MSWITGTKLWVQQLMQDGYLLSMRKPSCCSTTAVLNRDAKPQNPTKVTVIGDVFNRVRTLRFYFLFKSSAL